MKDLAKRIVIIGAGASGLTAAETLKRKGYTNITILERLDRAGGKCCSVEYDGRMYELGAGVLSAANHTALALAKQYHVPTRQAQFGHSMLMDVETGNRIPEKSLLGKLFELHKELLRYRTLLKTYAQIAKPGFTDAPEELCMPFTEWAKKHRIEKIAKEMEPFFTGFGYGYYDNISAAYVLKYYPWEILTSFASKKMYTFPNGIQSLWAEVAKHNTVQYNTTIQRITRDGKTITINTTTQTLECDALIVTSPLDEFTTYADASPEEHELFEHISYCDYRTYAVFLNNFPNTSGYVPGNCTPSQPGQPVYWYQRYTDSNLYTFYVLGDWKITDEAVLQNITHVVEQLGGTVDRVHTIQHWKYFPHITPQQMRDGYFDRFEKLQGNNNTYYAGELPNFSTVGLTAEYAEALAQRFF